MAHTLGIDPAQWLWIHRRWTTPRDIEKIMKMGMA
jgi:lauroyl/myristoyl acyltransferase